MKIQTKRLELGVISPGCVDTLMELLTDPVVKQTYMVPDFPDPESARALAERIIGLSSVEDRSVLGIFLEGQMIGILNKTDGEADWLEIGYALLPRYHNRGYCTEAVQGVIPWFFAQGFRKVIAGAFETNIPSLRVMEKSGMKKIDRRDEVTYRGEVHSCVYYVADAGKWEVDQCF